jgi:hypothetical protein
MKHRPVAMTQGSPARRPATGLACRPITERDFEAVIGALKTGFPERDEAYWRRALARMKARTIPAGHVRYGYVMTDAGRVVGLVLVIASQADDGRVRMNLSSWYVDEAYRSFANLLLAKPFRSSEVTFLNVTPAVSTLQTITAQGFAPYVAGSFQTTPALKTSPRGAQLRHVDAATEPAGLLADHAAWGCLCFEVSHEGRTLAFVFVKDKTLKHVPAAQLVYCRDVADFVRYAGLIGRALLRFGAPVVLIDALGPIDDLPGVYRPLRGRRYFRGPARPRIGDLAYTELALFGP